MRTGLCLVAVVMCCCGPSVAHAEGALAGVLESLVTENLEATQAEDMDRMMATIHAQSPAYATTKRQTAPLFEKFDLTYEVLSFTYIGNDDKYAVARVRQATRRVAGPAFRDNELDLVHVFRQEEGEWKFWTQTILELTFIDE
jgi:hypothetical protein